MVGIKWVLIHFLYGEGAVGGRVGVVGDEGYGMAEGGRGRGGGGRSGL